MANWKRRVAKEWLIFLCTIVLVGPVSCGAFYVKYRVDNKQYEKEYEKEVTKWVKANLGDWKPEDVREVAPTKSTLEYEEVLEALKKAHEMGNVEDVIKLAQIADKLRKGQIRQPKEKTSGIGPDKRNKRLPDLDYRSFPDKPKSSFDTFETTFITLAPSTSLIVLAYLLLLFIRSIVWATRQVRL